MLLIALAVPTFASAQATRTWVSGVGDDANPCSRTAPCKTFAGAISKTANGGEINCLDPGGFGGVTITKSLTIKCHYTEGGVLVSGTNAIVINAANTDTITLRGLDINGIGVGAQTSLSGVKVLNASKVNLVDNEIYRFQSGVTIVPAPATANTTRTVLRGNHIHDNGIGVINAPGNNNAVTVATLRYNDIQGNTCGVSSSAFGTNASTPTTTTCGANSAASGINQVAATKIYHSGINDNPTGLQSRGASSTIEIAYDEITGSGTSALHRLDGGLINSTTPATNVLSNGAPGEGASGTIPLGKRLAKRIRG
jgi:hypothetical protein